MNKTYAVGVIARAATGFFAPFDKLRTGCGSMEVTVFFVRFGGFAAKTNEINVSCRQDEWKRLTCL
jgi:hypothetical protein